MAKPTKQDIMFVRDPITCGCCGSDEATHQISIRVNKGLDYPKQQQLYLVEYAVCGACAKNAVVVQLGAQLNVRDKR